MSEILDFERFNQIIDMGKLGEFFQDFAGVQVGDQNQWNAVELRVPFYFFQQFKMMGIVYIHDEQGGFYIFD